MPDLTSLSMLELLRELMAACSKVVEASRALPEEPWPLRPWTDEENREMVDAMYEEARRLGWGETGDRPGNDDRPA